MAVPETIKSRTRGVARLYRRYKELRRATTASYDSSSVMGDLQTGHSKAFLDVLDVDSVSAIQVSRQFSWASRLHGHGLTHAPLGASLSFWRQIQQTRWSAVAIGAGMMPKGPDGEAVPLFGGADVILRGDGDVVIEKALMKERSKKAWSRLDK
jgi:hypothetical protein